MCPRFGSTETAFFGPYCADDVGLAGVIFASIVRLTDIGHRDSGGFSRLNKADNLDVLALTDLAQCTIDGPL